MQNIINNPIKYTFLTVMKSCLFIVLLGSAANCLAATSAYDELSSTTVNPKLWQKIDLNKQNMSPKNKLKKGTFVGYSHNVSKYLGLDLSVDSYIYSNKSDNSFAWVIGVVSDLFKLNYHLDQKEKNEYVEVVTHYPLSDSLRVTGYAGNKNDGKYEYKDYSVGLAYSVNTSVEISAGYADRELKKSDAEGNLFLNINGTF